MAHATPDPMSNRELAKAAGISESYLCEMLKGDKPGTPKTWRKLADALGVRYGSIVQDGTAA